MKKMLRAGASRLQPLTVRHVCQCGSAREILVARRAGQSLDDCRPERRRGIRRSSSCFGCPSWDTAQKGGHGLQLHACGRLGIKRNRCAKTHQGSRDPASLDGRVDMPFFRWSHSGDRSRRQRAKAVSLPRALPGSARKYQVRAYG